jgi:hypothetical protein
MLSMRFLDLDGDPEELLVKLQALRKAGLQVSLQVKGNREQAAQLFTQLAMLQGLRVAAHRRFLWSLVPAGISAFVFIWVGILFWVL